jgi:hypothetical protein
MVSAEVETAFSFLEVLQQTEREREELDYFMEDHPVAEGVLQGWADTEKALRIANATWARRLIDSDMLAIIEGYLKATPLQVRRNAFAGTATLATPGLLSGLRDKVASERRNMEQNAGGQFSTVAPQTYLEMLAEGLVDWALRTAADESYEVRGCTQCGKWFEPALKSRSRFCSDKCRKTFNNIRSSTDSDISNFVCAGCGTSRPMEEFAGLRFEDTEGKTATPLRISRYMLGAEDLCCVPCVRSSHPEWRRYIAPMEKLSERASA